MGTSVIQEDEMMKKIAKVRSFPGIDFPESDILRALSISGNDTDEAVRILLETPLSVDPITKVKRTSTGVRVSAQIKQEAFDISAAKNGSLDDLKSKVGMEGEKSDLGIEERTKVKEEPVGLDQRDVPMRSNAQDGEAFVGLEMESDLGTEMKVMVEEEPVGVNGFEVKSSMEEIKPSEGLKLEEKDMMEEPGSERFMGLKVESGLGTVKKEPMKVDSDLGTVKKDLAMEEPMEIDQHKSKKERKDSDLFDGATLESDLNLEKKGRVKEEPVDVDQYQAKRQKKESDNVSSDDIIGLGNNYFSSYNPQSKPGYAKKQETARAKIPGLSEVEDGEFPDEPDWRLVGRSTVAGLSTCRGKKLDFNEIVHFAFPSTAWTKIVRFSTKRSGEIGRLPIEWTKCIIPLVNASKVKIRGRCVAAPLKLSLMQEIHLYVSFYIHDSIFTDGNKFSWSLSTPSKLDSTVHPLLTLFKLLQINPFQKAEFTPEELDPRKRALSLRGSSVGDVPLLSLTKGNKVNLRNAEQKSDEQVISESALNKIVGTVDVYNLKEMDPPRTLMCVLHPYQKQALYWMSESEKGVQIEQAAKTLHPCWAAYRLTDKKASSVYVNIFSGEATTRFPGATKMAKGGILADAMGLGKTVMTIALILTRSGKGVPEDEVVNTNSMDTDCEEGKHNKKVSTQVKGGTLIVCPMALLGQWKDELDTHSRPGSLRVFVQYGVDRSVNPVSLSQNDVVLTTYGVLAAAYKSDPEGSIFHKVEWFRVVLDEAHTIKSSKTQVAQAAFALSSHCRWCLTGTPIQNNLEDLYSLLCFLHVEPWCNWVWWQKLIQKPYENGDERAMTLIKSILRQLMLRRTKDTKDKEGRPILVLPPTDIQVIECKQSEAERDFYDALFKRSKVQFDQFVAQGKVLHNYANILELLLRLRQCCNHPFLVMSRADSQKYTDLSKLTRQFLETSSNSRRSSQVVPTRAFVEKVVEDIRKGENTECPICLESADDPVLTPCGLMES